MSPAAAERPPAASLVAGSLSVEEIARAPIIWNPRAGTKAGVRLARIERDQLMDLLERHGLRGPLIETSSSDDAVARLREVMTGGAGLVIAAGGDGTVGTVAVQVLGTGVAVGVLPLGSLMNLARSLGIPRDLEEAMAVVAAGRVQIVDAARIDGRFFFEVASVGLSAAVLGEAHSVSKGQFGAIANAFRVIFRYRPTTFELELGTGLGTDARVEQVRGLLVSVANAPYTGFGLTLAPDARIDDGVLDVVVFQGYSRTGFVRHLIGSVAGRRASSARLVTYRAKRVRVDAVRALSVRADAFDAGTTPVAIEVIPGALRVVVPERPAEGAAFG